MGYKFGQNSEKHLATVKSELTNVCRRALAYGIMGAVVTQGRRDKDEQDKYFQTGKTKVQWPNSKHNVVPPEQLSKAVDIVPCVNGEISWNTHHCLVWAGLMLAAAVEEGVNIRWGGNWDTDHFEIVG